MKVYTYHICLDIRQYSSHDNDFFIKSIITYLHIKFPITTRL